MSTAPRSQTPVNVDDDLQVVIEQIDALKRLGAKHELAEGESYDFSIRWGTALAGRLRRLVHYSTRGLLSDADGRRFRSLCDDLRTLSDLIDRFELAHPVFTAGPPAKAKRHGAGRFANSRRGILRRGRENPSPAT
ncbi:hypothetical protein [Mycobacterium xenopi]|uniref:Uncharacterized protein n=2 Tax=Mycobacterium xenopi TaxID=1789 RepID=A0AAD1H1A7_MYCXE|nr:hypothetical protein [Mycobacterium xenopi]EID15720.1 hypothetical protein MXEN_05873 [Mycobacterium xenopi RIVM700367]MDA3639818.1 hypothetical protein [Mycobacterium xenopi]MDA3658178.1 hypothetical protein [Mycobacterium xenopi]SPX88911.1 Uncharacterised protein [Mycobacterium xenopi]BBU23263.1 hypothetical protein MYXE_30530 [Mycobacterium xenopi]